MYRELRFVVVLAALVCIAGSLAAAEPGWQELFNGKDLSAWQNAGGGDPGAGWVVEDGAMVRKERAGDAWTKERFGDFVLDLEFKTEGNSGIFIRTDDPKKCVQTGIEIQVYTPSASPSTHSTGAVYDAQAPTKVADKPGVWNHIVITAKDNEIQVVMNDEKIVDMDLDRWTEAGKNPDGSKNKFSTALKDFKREGHIGFQDHGAAVAFRNVKIKTLD